MSYIGRHFSGITPCLLAVSFMLQTELALYTPLQSIVDVCDNALQKFRDFWATLKGLPIRPHELPIYTLGPYLLRLRPHLAEFLGGELLPG